MLDTQNLVRVVKCTITTGLERRLARKRKKEEKKFLPGLHLIIPLLNLISSQHSPLHIARRTNLLVTFLFILVCPRSMDVPHDSISHTLPSLLSSFFFFSSFTHFFCCISFGFVLYIWWPLNSFIHLCIFLFLFAFFSFFALRLPITFVYNDMLWFLIAGTGSME